jgi:hypothetical protein
MKVIKPALGFLRSSIFEDFWELWEMILKEQMKTQQQHQNSLLEIGSLVSLEDDLGSWFS